MGKISRAGVLLLFILFLIAPLFADNGEEGLMGPPKEEEVVIQEDAVNEDVVETESGEGVITGSVVSLDAAAGAITVKMDTGENKTFSIVDGETILWKGIDDIKLSDINKGEEAEVGYYTDEAGKLIASWVDVIVEDESAPAAPEAVSEELQYE